MSTAPVATSESKPPASPTQRNWVWFSIQVVLRVLFTLWFRFRARGLHHLRTPGAGLILANHQSFLDPLLIGLSLSRPISFVARHNLFPVPVIGWILRHTYVMPINQERATPASIRQTVARIEQGFLVGLFPEGARSVSGEMGEFRPGFAALVRRTNVPIYPVGIAGAVRAMRRGSMLIKPCRVCVVFGPPIEAAELEPFKERGKEEALIAIVRSRIAACTEEAESWLRR